MRLTIIGCGDAFGAGGRLQTSFQVRSKAANFLIDCGTTSLIGMRRLGLQPNDQQVADVQGILAGTKTATEVVAQLPADATRIVGVVRDAFVDAFQLVARVNAAISLVAVVVSVLFIGHWRRDRSAPAK